LFIFFSLCTSQLALDSSGTIRLTTIFNGSIASYQPVNVNSPLLVDSHGTNDIETDLGTYQTSLRAAEHLKLFFIESRKYQSINTNIFITSSAMFIINGVNYLAFGDAIASCLQVLQWDSIKLKYSLLQIIPTVDTTSDLNFFSFNGLNYLLRVSYIGTTDQIYLWNGTAFSPNSFQNIPGQGFLSHYDACILPGPLNTQILQLIRAGSTTTLFQFTGTTFQPVPSVFPTVTTGVRCFNIGTTNYVVLGTTGVIHLFDWSTGGQTWSNISASTITGLQTPISMKFFNTLNAGVNTTYMAVVEVNLGNNPSPAHVFQWVNTGFSNTPISTLTNGGDVEVFTIDTTTYLLLLSGFTPAPSYFYRFNPNLYTFDIIGTLTDCGNGMSTVKSTLIASKRYVFVGYPASTLSYVFQLI